VTLGNGSFDDMKDGDGFPFWGDYGGAFVKLSATNGTLRVADYFAMFNVQEENRQDLDFASGSALVLPDLVDGLGAPRQLVVVSAKDEAIYIAERSNMGKFSPDNNNALYQQSVARCRVGPGPCRPFSNNTLYYGPVGSPILAFPFQKCPANCEFFPITVQLRLSRSDAQHLRQWSKQRHRLGRRGCRNHYDEPGCEPQRGAARLCGDKSGERALQQTIRFSDAI